MTTAQEIAPRLRPHRDALAAGRLAFPFCEECARYHWYPMVRCPHCCGSRITWRDVEGRGRLFSWTIVRHAFDPAWRDALPYVVALVRFSDAPGITLVANIEDATEGELRVDLPLRLRPAAIPADPPRAVFEVDTPLRS